MKLIKLLVSFFWFSFKEEEELSKRKDSVTSKVSKVTNFLGRIGKMNVKNVWLLSFLVLMLAFGFFVGNIRADMDNIEASDAEGFNSNEYGITGVLCRLEGKLDGVDEATNLKRLFVTDTAAIPTTVLLTEDSLDRGGFKLTGIEGAEVNGDEVWTNSDGDYVVTFFLPYALAPGNVTFHFEASSPEADTIDFMVQTPIVTDTDENYDDKDVFKNGDAVEFTLTLEFDNDEIDLCEIFGDFRQIDKSFGTTDGKILKDDLSNQIPHMPLLMNHAPANFNELTAIERAINLAIGSGRLVITEEGNGDYTIKYTIPLKSGVSSGYKQIAIYAIDYPSNYTVAQIEDYLDEQNLDFADLNIMTWQNGVDYEPAVDPTDPIDYDGDTEAWPIDLDNEAPNFDFAMINPFTNNNPSYMPPKAVWVEKNGSPGMQADEFNYAYKPGDKVTVMIQVDPDDLSKAEFNDVDAADVHSNYAAGLSIDLNVIGDISALLDPTKVNLTTDADNDGIPDVAEVIANYAGGGGGDDDFDQHDANEGRDEEDFTANGFYEPFLYTFTFTIDERFRAASGTNPATVTDLPVRFMVQDQAGNQGHYSSWYETFNTTTKTWIPSTTWSRDTTGLEGQYFPVYVDGIKYVGPSTNPDPPPDNIAGLLAHDPDVTKFPRWDAGRQIVANWDQPWRIRIDNWAPSVSRIEELNLLVDVEDDSDGLVKKGAAVITDVSSGTNVLSTVGTGNFIYEISGNQNKLVTLSASFPSDNDMDHVEFMISESSSGPYKAMKGQFSGDKNMSGLPDMAGNWTDPDAPGAGAGRYHDGINGDDDADGSADDNDDQVRAAKFNPQSDGIDNDADGLMDANDVLKDINGNIIAYTDYYDSTRDEDEDGIMDEDEYYIRTTGGSASWTFDPVRIARALNLIPGRTYAIKAFAFDKAGYALESAAAPIYVIFNVVGTGQEIQGNAHATLSKVDPATGNFIPVTVKPIPEKNQYVLDATTTGTVNSVTFQYAMGGKEWTTIPADPNPDSTAPFKTYWTPSLTALASDSYLFVDLNDNGIKDPSESYKAGLDLFIRAYPAKIGNLGKYKPSIGLTPDLTTFIPYVGADGKPIPGLTSGLAGLAPDITSATSDITVAVVDTTAPVLVITKAGTPGGEDSNMLDGALLQVAQDVTITAQALVADVYAHDIATAVFQYAMSNPDGTIANWVAIPGVVDKYIIPQGNGLSLVQAIVKWDTTILVPDKVSKRFDLRCVAADNAGNSDPQLAPIVHVVVGKGKYAAFVTDPNAGQTVSGPTYPVKAYIYNKSTDPASVKSVIFQFLKAGGIWTNIGSVDKNSTAMIQHADFSEWNSTWDVRDISGDIKIRALTEDDRGYINEGIEISVKVAGVSFTRAKISNFVSDATSNPRISMKIARDATNSYVTIPARNDLAVETLRVKLMAAVVSGTVEGIQFQYAINKNSTTDLIDPKASATVWTNIGAMDVEAPYELDWDINAAHELANLNVATLVYVRALAYKIKTDPASSDKYVDQANYVPYVGIIFEESSEPTATIARLEHDGAALEAATILPSSATVPSFVGEMRITGGVLNTIPYLVDQGITDHRASGVSKLELFYKHTRKASRDGDTLLWQSAASDIEPPFAITWDVSKVATGKYDLMLVATDQAGNKSANVWNTIEALRATKDLVKILTIDNTGPSAAIEDPDGLTRDNRITPDNRNVWVAMSSYEGNLRKVELYYSVTPAVPAEVRTGSGTYGFNYLDLNNNGVYDIGEPWSIINPPGSGTGIPGQGTSAGPSWVKIGDAAYMPPSFTTGQARTDFAGIYYLDANSNDRFDAGETVWRDHPRGNTGRYNSNKHLLVDADNETIIMGGLRPADEAAGKPLQDIPGKDLTKDITGGGAMTGTTKWVDLNNNNVLDDKDFIWIDMDGDNQYDSDLVGTVVSADVVTRCHVAEPIIYTSVAVNWGNKLYEIPPTNNSQFDLLAKASDRKDSAGKEGNWGADWNSKIQISNIQVGVWSVKGRAVENKIDSVDPGKGGGGDYVGRFQRTTGNTVEVVVRVRPRPIDGAKVQLWFRYDDSLYPGAVDANFNGIPDDGSVVNSKWDGIDNDWNGVIDPEMNDADGHAHKWAEANTWQLASTTGGTVVTAEKTDGDAQDRWFEVKLVWDVSMLLGEFTYEFMPVVVDVQNYGVDFNYTNPTPPWIRSLTRFPQAPFPDNNKDDFPSIGYKITIDHEGPYTYTQVVKDTSNYDADKFAVNSFTPLDKMLTSYDTNIADAMIIRVNDGVQSSPNDKRNSNGDYTDDPGEDNYRTYDIQAKTVSAAGGYDYTKTLSDSIKGVEFQYRVAGAEWKTLGYDYDPDYLSTYYNASILGATANDVVSVERGRIAFDFNPGDDDYLGTLIKYAGVKVAGTIDTNDIAGRVAATAFAPRIVVANWSLDNVDIQDIAKFPWTNGTQYEFRVIAADQPDVYGNPGNKTIVDPAKITRYDKYVVEARVGDDKGYNDKVISGTTFLGMTFLRGINWQSGAPFNVNVALADLQKGNIFKNPRWDDFNPTYITGPRNDDGRGDKYWINNTIPKASIMRVGETTYTYTPEAGVDPNQLANPIDAVVMKGDDVLVEAIVNADPDKKLGAGSIWGTTDPNAVGDISQVTFLARKHTGFGIAPNPTGLPIIDINQFIINNTIGGWAYTTLSGNIVNIALASGWVKVGMGQVIAGKADAGSRFTARLDTDKMATYLGTTIDMMAIAKDKHGNEQPLIGPAGTGEIVIQINDMIGPKIKLGGLALDILQAKKALDNAATQSGMGSSITAYLGIALLNDSGFSDVANLDLNNFGNAIFPANPRSIVESVGTTRPATKVSGEVLDLYLYNPSVSVKPTGNDKNSDMQFSEIPKTGITVTVYDKYSTPVVKKTADYVVDVRVDDSNVNAAKIPHTFVLSENAARIYLPTWVDSGKTKSRFEGVKMYYYTLANVEAVGVPKPSDLWTGSTLTPPNMPFGDNVALTQSVNSKGESIWSYVMNLEAGKTYYYYFVADTVGDTWVIPDPKNLAFDSGIGGMVDWWKNNKQYLLLKNWFINMPVVSKIWVPGTAPTGITGGKNVVDDEFWYTGINLDGVADGVYEVRVDVKDSAGLVSQAVVSKTIIVDRTPPAVDPNAVINVAGRVKANSSTPLTVVLHDQVGINAIDTAGVLFEVSKRGNTEEATSTWMYAISPENILVNGVSVPRPLVSPELQSMFDYYTTLGGSAVTDLNWLRKIALDVDPADGWSIPWQTPDTDQNVKYFVRAVPIDDALNVQVDQTNQVEVWVDGTMPKAKIMTASVNRDGTVVSDGADGFEILPTDKDVTLTATIQANSDGDLNLDGIIDPGTGENANHGVKSVQFEYSLMEKVPTTTTQGISWYPIKATQYNNAVLAPNADGSWSATWQVDFSKLYNAEKDQYLYLRAVAEDEVGNKDSNDSILTVIVLNDVTGPAVQIREIKGPLYTAAENALSPHLAVSRGTTDVNVKISNKVAAVKLQYRASGATDWTEIKTVSRTVNAITSILTTIQWDTSRLEAGKYDLMAIGYDGDGNPTAEPHSIVVVVDYTEPSVTGFTMKIDRDNDGDHTLERTIVPGDNIYRYKADSVNRKVRFEVKADSTDPIKVEAKSVVLQYFNRTTLDWTNVRNGVFTYTKKDGDLWYLDYPFGPDTNLSVLPNGIDNFGDGKIWFRAFVTDYAGNTNKLDKGYELMADANAPNIVAIYSGGMDYKGGNVPTVVAYGGDKVDLWAKVEDSGAGVDAVKFFTLGSPAANTDPSVLPVPATDWVEIGSGLLVSSNGVEELWHFVWTTPLNMVKSPFTYAIAAKGIDKAANEKLYTNSPALVKVEKDVTPPVAPQILYVITHAGRYTNNKALPYILDEYNASDYNARKMLPIGISTDRDAGGPDKYQVYDLFNDWDKGAQVYIDPDQRDTALEIVVRTPNLEFGVQPGVATWRQYENYNPTNATGPGNLGDDDGPAYLNIPYAALGRDPGISRVYTEIGYDPNQDGDYTDVVWLPLNNIQNSAGDRADVKYMDPRKIENGDWDDINANQFLKKQKPLDLYPVTLNGVRQQELPAAGSDLWNTFNVGSKDPSVTAGKYGDVVRVPLYNGDPALQGYAYYWIMGDDYAGVNTQGETVWNTEASVDDNNETLDPTIGKDGIYFIRTWAEDTTGNGNPKADEARRQFGYAKIIVHNQDSTPPAETTIVKLDDSDNAGIWPVMEWKWHKVEVRTKRNPIGPWFMGGTDVAAKTVNLTGTDITYSKLDSTSNTNNNFNTYNKFFNDIDYVVVEAFDNENQTWVNVTKDSKQRVASTITDGDFFSGDRNSFKRDFLVLIDSTLVGDGNTKMRAYAVDNGGRFAAGGVAGVHEQRIDPDRRNFENKDVVTPRDIKIDNPRATVVLPTSGTIIERGTTVQIQAMPVELDGWDLAKNGPDVGQVVFLVKRQAASGGVEGPWILLDAVDNDLDGLFGEDAGGTDYDKDGNVLDAVNPSDTNEPYMIYWKVPDWLVIDDPNTETTIEDTSKYWIVGVAGDSNTGPLVGNSDIKMLDRDLNTIYSSGVTSSNFMSQIHWDNPWHIIKRTQRAALVTVADLHPPKTRVLQVDRYSVPSEVKMVVGKTITVMAGDTEVDWVPPGTFPTPILDSTNDGSFANNNLTITDQIANRLWPADGSAWAYGMLYPPLYDPDVAPEKYNLTPAWEVGNGLPPAEWRANGRVTLRYAGPYATDAIAPVFPTSGQKWEDTAWKTAEADAIDIGGDNATAPIVISNPGIPKWKVTNWVTGGTVLPDGKYFITVTATDDVNHTTGVPVGSIEPVMPDVVDIYIKNTTKPIQIAASQLLVNGTLNAITNKEMERGEPLVLGVDPKMDVSDMDKVTFQFKTQHDYDWKTVTVNTGTKDPITNKPIYAPYYAKTQPYSVTLSPVGSWDGQTGSPANIVLGAIYQFKAVGEDQIGNKVDSNIIELTVVDKVSMAAIARIVRMDGYNADEMMLTPEQIDLPRLTGKVTLYGYTDSDTVRVTLRYKADGASTWTDIEALPEPVAQTWDQTGLSYSGLSEWQAVWDTTTLQDGLYDLTIVANSGDNKSAPSDILKVVVDHNAYDIFDNVTDNTPKDGEAVGGWTRRPVASQNPILTPDQKEMIGPRGEVDLGVTFGKGFADLDMGVPTNGPDALVKDALGNMVSNLANLGTALLPSLKFEYKESAYPNVGDITKDDSTLWKSLNHGSTAGSTVTDIVVYDAATMRFSAVWHTGGVNGCPVLNGRYDVRAVIEDEAGNVAYKVIAKGVIVDNTAPDVVISNVAGDTTLSPDLATDTELMKNEKVVVRATAVDSLTSVAYVQFQVMADTIQSTYDPIGIGDLITGTTYKEWVDIGLATKDADPKDSYSLLWDTTGLFEGTYKLRVKATDRLGNMDYSNAIVVTVIDTTPPIASIVGYYPNQLHFLNWPKKYWFDTLYAATICQYDIQEVQFQYRGISDTKWTTIGIPIGQIERIEDKLGEVSKLKQTLFPTTLAVTEAITEMFNWTSLWGTTWNPNLADGTYQLRAVAKDMSGNIDPELAPILTVSVVNGVVQPITPGSGIKVDFTANLGGTGREIGDLTAPVYSDTPTVVVEVDSPDKPIVFMLFEFQAPEGLSFDGGQVENNPNGLVIAGTLLDMKPVQGELGKYTAALTGTELPIMSGSGVSFTYLDLLRYGGKLVTFVSTNSGSVSTSLMMDDLKIYPVTAELGTNGTAFSKDGNVTVTIPRAALTESQLKTNDLGEVIGKYAKKLGLMITPSITPNTPKDQRLIIEPVGQAYSIEMFDYWSSIKSQVQLAFWEFRPGFEPRITIDYSGSGIPADLEANGFVSVRYWQKDASAFGGSWANDDIINLSVDAKTKKVSFNLKKFGYKYSDGNIVPHNIYSIVLEKSLGRVDEITFFGEDDSNVTVPPTIPPTVTPPAFNNPAFRYNADPSMSYLSDIEGGYIRFRIVDPSGIDRNSIKLYIDGQLYGARSEDFDVAGSVTPDSLDTDMIFYFKVPKELSLTEGVHVVKIEAWDKSDAVNESDWQQLEATARFFLDWTAPQVVTQGAQKDGIRYFKSVDGATAAITLVDEGVGLSAADLQRYINVDIFKWLTPQTTAMNTTDQGNVINYQRKTLVATSKPIVEYADDYTPDGIDNEKWMGVADGASDQRHKAWRASYTIQVGQVVDGETYEIVFYAYKPQPMVLDLHNENAVYLYEDLTKAYLAVWKGDTADNLSVSADLTLEGIVSVPATQVPDFYKLGVANLITTADSFTGYYQGTFLSDILGNGASNGYTSPLNAISTFVGAITEKPSSPTSPPSYSGDISYFVRHLVADTRGPIVTLNVPQGVKADDAAATVSGTIVDDGSGIANAKLVINGVVKAEKNGPISNVTLEYTFGKGEVVGANEIKVVVVDQAGNETVTRGSFGVQEMDAPIISDMSPSGDGITDATPTISAAYADKTGIDLKNVTLTLNGAVLTDVTIGQSTVSYTPTSPLKAGVVYTVKLAVKDIAGNPSEKVWTFSLENIAPSITDTTPTAVDKTGMPIISAKFADTGTGINKESVSLRVDKQAVAAQVTDAGVSFKSSTIMAKGKHTAELSVADVAGNVGTLAWEFSIEEDAPVVTDVIPSGSINDDMPVISAKYSDTGTGIDLASVTMTLNGDVVSATIGAGEVSYSVKEPLKPSVGYSIGIRVADKAGNVGTASGSFKLEVTAPIISGMSPTGTIQSVDVAVSANYSDAGAGIDLTTSLMKVDGAVVNANASASGISYPATKLMRGEHTVYVEVADQFGNSASQNWTFKVEDTPPVIATVEPNSEVNTATPVLKATYSDAGTGINVASVVLSLNGQILPAIATASQVSYEILTPLEKGVTYKVSVQVADKAGNIASKDSSFSLETKAPVISGTKPTGTVAEADAVKGVLITATLADDGSGVNPESVKMWLDGAPVMANATASNATYSAKGLSYGEHNVRLVVADMLNNVADTSWKFSVADSTPPTVTVVSPKQDAVVGVRPVIRISYADEGSGVDLTSITVTVDDKPVSAGAMAPAVGITKKQAPAKPGDTKVVSAGESSYEVKLAFGSHTLTVAVKDVAGNEATAEVKFMVEGDVLEIVKAHNYPNPFRGDTTKFVFGLSKRSEVSIRVYDFTNTLVATVAEQEAKDASEKVEFSWDGTTDVSAGKQLATGVYFAQVVVKTDSETKSQIIKIALVRE